MDNKGHTISFDKFHWIYLTGFFLILALPLLSVPPWFSPPDWGKTIVFKIVLSILIFLFLYQVLFQERYNTLSTAVRKVLQGPLGLKLVFGLLISLFLVFLLATIFSLNPHFSFWSSPYRSGGFLNFAFYIIFAVLAFLILRKSDWQRIWDFSILVGVLVSLIAIFQWQGLLKDILITYEARPPSTIGGAIFLAIYLLLLSFLALSSGIKEKSWRKKAFYFASLLLFLFVAIFVTQTRAAIIGFALGFIYFIVFYPYKKILLSLGLKIAVLILLILGILGIYYLNNQPQLPQFIEENKLLKEVASRTSIENVLQDQRISGWIVSWEALKDKPVLGYGPENLSIGFDKFYDPSLPYITIITWGGGWWDRAHSFVFDISTTAGIPALVIYLSLFGALFWQLQRLKYNPNSTNENPNVPNKHPSPVIIHGVQAAFIGYLTANFFGFDAFSTYLISFLLIAYSLHLISSNQIDAISINQQNQHKSALSLKILKWRGTIIFILFISLVWFIWNYNVKPLQINKEINWAQKYYLLKENNCDKALATMESILPSRSIIDHYLRLAYVDIINECFDEKPERKLELAKKEIQILKENVKLRPYYTRNWWFLGASTNFLISYYENQGAKKETIEELEGEANFYLEKAHQLSPKRQEILMEWAKAGLLAGQYQQALDRAEKCIEIKLEAEHRDCYWLTGLAKIYLGKVEEGQADIERARVKRYRTDLTESLLQLAKAYIHIKDYRDLVGVYQILIEREPENYQYHGSLATSYKELGQFEKARKEALIILKLAPELRTEVEEFLETLY